MIWTRKRRTDATDQPRSQRWSEEAAFFDQTAGQHAADVVPIDPLAVRRYSSPRLRRRFNKEFRFRLAGRLNGREVLDVGCGEGADSILLAKLGARVTGVDISSRSIEIAKTRAGISKVGESVRFVQSPLETAQFSDNSFDVVWCNAILHHVIPELDVVMDRLARWARPGALLLFTEPISYSRALRRIRSLIPVRTETTPGERPLEETEIKTVKRYVPDLKIRHFSLLGRLDRFILLDHNFERSPFWRRLLCHLVSTVDYFLLSLPGFAKLAGQAVMYGHPKK